jgi:hypothetical protein
MRRQPARQLRNSLKSMTIYQQDSRTGTIFAINMERCMWSLPCCHEVYLDGVHHQSMDAREIVTLFRARDLQVPDHFSECA